MHPFYRQILSPIACTRLALCLFCWVSVCCRSIAQMLPAPHQADSVPRLSFSLPDSLKGSADFVYIDSIELRGNRRTRGRIILRELEIASGDSIRASDLGATLERNALRLQNTGLFSVAKINVAHWNQNNHLVLRIDLVESWYIYPVPLFELADRNFNVWWHEFNRSLRRVNYGLDLNHLNLTGEADHLKFKVQFGYSNKYEVAYSLPNFNPSNTLGFSASVAYSRTHDIAWNTLENKLLFTVDNNQWLIERWTAGLSLTWRPKLYARHTVSAEFRHNRIADSVAFLNPDFFLDGRTEQRHLSLGYTYTKDRLDIRPYPIKGWWFGLEARQNGLLPSDDIHLFRLYAEYDRYFKLSKKFSLETNTIGRTSLPRSKPPYANNQALGYGGQFVRGYEYYVVDGLDFALFKTSLHFEIFNHTFQLGRLMPVEAFKVLPLKLYFAVNNDLGYANDPYYAASNPLANRWLWGYGLGLDFLAYYDKSIRLEWSWNDLGENGPFLRINAGF